MNVTLKPAPLQFDIVAENDIPLGRFTMLDEWRGFQCMKDGDGNTIIVNDGKDLFDAIFRRLFQADQPETESIIIQASPDIWHKANKGRPIPETKPKEEAKEEAPQDGLG
jgi:hypothetical protein